MVPRQAGLGRSFKGAGAYYLHDKDAATSERVAFTHTENIPTQDPEKALKWMAWTAIHAEELKRESGVGQTGQPCAKPVFTFSLSWHPEQEPKKKEMVGAGRRALTALGLAEHETLMVSHQDTNHPHLHIIVNTIHPETGKVNTLKFSKLKLSKWAEAYELEHGKVYCEQRVEHNQRREQGAKVNVHADLITHLYHAANGGAAFQEALTEHGFTLAHGRGTRILLIDPEGVVFNLVRRIDGVNSKDVKAKLGDLKFPPLSQFSDRIEPKRRDQSTADEREEALPSSEKVHSDRDRQEPATNPKIVATSKATSQPTPNHPKESIPSWRLNRLQDKHLAELGNFGTEKTLARLRLAEKLEGFYGEGERNTRSEIARMENTLRNSGWAKLLWLKLTHQIPQDPEQHLTLLRGDLENVQTLRRYETARLENEIRAERQALEKHHRQERAGLDFYAEPNIEGLPPRLDAIDEGEEIGPSMEY